LLLLWVEDKHQWVVQIKSPQDHLAHDQCLSDPDDKNVISRKAVLILPVRKVDELLFFDFSEVSNVSDQQQAHIDIKNKECRSQQKVNVIEALFRFSREIK